MPSSPWRIDRRLEDKAQAAAGAAVVRREIELVVPVGRFRQPIAVEVERQTIGRHTRRCDQDAIGKWHASGRHHFAQGLRQPWVSRTARGIELGQRNLW